MDPLDVLLKARGIEHFTAKEILRTSSGNPRPDETLWFNIIPTLQIAEFLRAQFGGRAVTVNSGYRSVEYNKRVGGEPNSLHLRLNALDLVFEAASPREVRDALVKEGLHKWMGIKAYPTFTHIDTRRLVFGMKPWLGG